MIKRLYFFKAGKVCHHLFSARFVEGDLHKHVVTHGLARKNYARTEGFMLNRIADVIADVGLFSLVPRLTEGVSRGA